MSRRPYLGWVVVVLALVLQLSTVFLVLQLFEKPIELLDKSGFSGHSSLMVVALIWGVISITQPLLVNVYRWLERRF